MPSYDTLHWVTFLTAALLLNLSPGPDLAFILARTLGGGIRAGLGAMFGVWTGTLLHVALAALGVSALLVASAELFSLVKWAGAAYLVWLGLGALRGGGVLAVGAPQRGTLAGAFRQGVLVSALNPKVAVFFLAFLPQFVEPGAGPAWLQLTLHGLLVIAVAALVEPLAVFGAARLADGLKRRAWLGAWLDRGLGALLIGLGLRLGLARD